MCRRWTARVRACAAVPSRSAAYPKTRSGWDMKSVMRSSILRGSRTHVGKVTRERSIPTLHEHGVSVIDGANGGDGPELGYQGEDYGALILVAGQRQWTEGHENCNEGRTGWT